jgi:Family of unknown function (DUF6152)
MKFALNVRSSLLGLALSALGSTLAFAHHSFAMFDFSKQVSIHGTVKEFQWTNPHVVLWVNVAAAPGEAAATWSLELTSPGNLTRGGWTRHAFAAGDEVIVELNPLRNGNHGGALVKATQVKTGVVFSTNLRDLERPGLK